MRLVAAFSCLILVGLLGGCKSSMTTAFENGIDRPGQDIKNFDLERPDPQLCFEACAKEPKCKAWTYVKPDVQGPKARCWLKNGVPEKNPDDCCVSGVK